MYGYLHYYFYKDGVPQGSHSGPHQKRVGQISQQHPSDNYVNVALDLIDFSDADTTPPSNGVVKANNVNARNDVFDGRSGKLPVFRQTSSPDYVGVDKSRNNSDDTSSEYVVVPPRGLCTEERCGLIDYLNNTRKTLRAKALHREVSSELKIHKIYGADVTKNCRYYHSFTSRVKSMDGCW